VNNVINLTFMPNIITAVGLFVFDQPYWALPAGLGWMLLATGPLSLMWIFCFVDWDKIEPPKKEGGQIEVGSVNADVGCTPKSGGIPEPTLYTEVEKLRGHST
jgi:hypothetical protein